MKKMLKSALAFALCLALLAAIVPATALAVETEPKTGDIVPGVVSVGLNEAYVGDPAELFPYLEIEEIRDQYLSVVISSGKTVDNVNESIRKMIGTTFVIKLAEKTERAVYEAIALLTEDSRVKYAEPDHVVGPDIVVPDIGTPTITDALAVLRVTAGLVPATPEVIYLFDKDGDGKITVTDALMVLRIAAKLA